MEIKVPFLILFSSVFLAICSPAEEEQIGMDFETFSQRKKVAALPEEKRRVLFDRIDKNRDGLLTLNETARSARTEKGFVFPVPWPKQVLKVDADKDGRLALTEFLLLPAYTHFTVWSTREAFAQMDLDEDGYLDEIEMRQARAKTKERPNLVRMDLDGDGQVSREEFDQAPMIRKLPEGRREFVFDRLDKNKNGFIDGEDEARN